MAARAAAQDRIQTLTAYDQVAYTNHPYPQTDPDHLAVLARLHGLEPGPVSRARVLDLGASEGGNIIPLALTLPEAEFTGIDLAVTPIERGCATIADLGLTNVRLLQNDLLELDASFGPFDYVIAHGLYGWTPPEVGDKILALARSLLTPNGVAFVSYNTLPGGHVRKLVREMMLFQAGRFPDPRRQVAAARAMLDLVAAGCPEPDPIEQAVAFQADSARERSDSSLYHDYLSPVYEPVYFQDFAAHAARHGLAYMADASVMDSYNMKLSSDALEAVRHAGTHGRIVQEQLLDMLRVRRFRRSLVCHEERKPMARWNPDRAVGLYASSATQETGESEFSSTGGMKLRIEGPAAALLRDLIELWPESRQLQHDEVDMALELYRRDMILLGTLPSLAARAGERPIASPLVRYQAARGDESVSTLRHRALAVEDEDGRKLLAMLDGSWNRDELAAAMRCSREQIDERLAALARHSVLLGQSKMSIGSDLYPWTNEKHALSPEVVENVRTALASGWVIGLHYFFAAGRGPDAVAFQTYEDYNACISSARAGDKFLLWSTAALAQQGVRFHPGDLAAVRRYLEVDPGPTGVANQVLVAAKRWSDSVPVAFVADIDGLDDIAEIAQRPSAGGELYVLPLKEICKPELWLLNLRRPNERGEVPAIGLY